MGYNEVNYKKDAVFLVTGGAGFIGSNICEVLLKRGHSVRCLDDLSTGKKENICGFQNDHNFIFLEGDIRDLDTCIKATQDVDFVLHQAAWGCVPKSLKYPLVYEEINIKGTLNLLQASRLNGVKKFVYASSSSVYGDEQGLPKREGVEGNLLSPYALTKMVCEEYAKQYTRHYGLDTYGLRYFNVFGKRQDPHSSYAAVIPIFIKKLLNGEQPIIFGDGKQSRDFTYIENVIEANLKACDAPTEAAGQAYNIAYGDRQQLIDMYMKLCELLNVNISPVFRSDRPGDIKHSHADISKARELLGYNPSWSFDDGIVEAIQWYKDYLK